jgi:hypothetical protein
VVDATLDSHPYVSICAVEGSCDDAGMPTIECRSSNNPAEMDIPVNVAVGTEISFRADALPGLHASSVTRIAYLVNDPEPPANWTDYSMPENRCYPIGSQGIVVAADMNTYHVWVKDDYCEFGSTSVAYIIINGVGP